MNALQLGGGAFAFLILLLALNVPVGYALAFVGITGLLIVGGANMALQIATTLPYEAVAQYSLVIIPMFVLMGALAAATNITTDLYEALNKWVGGARGSLLSATVLASGGFAAISGSTVVNSMVFTRIALPEMIRLNYDRGVAAACIAAAGTFAALIPPSLAMVFFALLTGESVGALLIAGIIPGLLTIVIYLIGIQIMTRLRPNLAPASDVRFTTRDKFLSLRKVLPILLLSGLVLGGIYSGAMFPSAAGAVGAAGALIIGLAMRRASRAGIAESLRSTASSTGVLLMIIVGGLMFSRMLVFSGFIGEVTGFVIDIGVNPVTFMIAISVIYLILGAFIDPTSILIITIPIFYPIAQSMNIDALWMAVIVVKLIELSCITPPVGLNLFAVLSAAKGSVKTKELWVGMIPFIVLELITLALLIAFPSLSTWLPSLSGL